ncbi:MAG: Protein-glutamate methylesterase [uncultured Gemmatimonadetes bacterium]|uniref:protein-glutamate methylesterase n=1 Tax=uncultured Gemmatimonadota bacterium TaxID=203437 RepID=A0A6J4KQR6_9BACT|nr:MAG: Protein-glutamate methylesterase [uncultured Gemmatimonadota bacterium]
MGGSAGAVEGMSQIVAGLPAGLPAAVFVVVHFPAYSTSVLPRILTRAGPLRAVHPRDGDPIEHGTIYVAPPDHHLLVEEGRVRVARGPRENGHRPAVDPLFRSAARAYGARVTGVVISGNLDDGTAGLGAVRARGGAAIVQDPEDALHPGMPSSALNMVGADRILPLDQIAAALVELATTPVPPQEAPVPHRLDTETGIAGMDPAALQGDERPGEPSGYSCPECHGSLFEIDEGHVKRFRCRVGHAYSVEALLAHQGDAVESALWTAMMALKERAALSRKMADRLRERGGARSAERFEQQAGEADVRAGIIQDVLRNLGLAAGQEAERTLERAGD